MKAMKTFLGVNRLWLVLFMTTDLIFSMLTCLIRPQAFVSVSLFLFLFSIGMLAIGYAVQKKRVDAICEAAEKFLEDPTEETRKALQLAAGAPYSQLCGHFFERISCLSKEKNDRQMALTNYQEYIEAWTHEMKTPLALMTLVQENHRDEMSEYVSQRLRYARLLAEQDVEQILYFARLQTDHVDYHYSRFRVDECIGEVIESYLPLAGEKKTVFEIETAPLEVVSDRRVVSFMLSQLLSNAVKYADSDGGRVTVVAAQTEGPDKKICVSVSDNGSGVLPEDLPFIFDKGFTGNHPERQKATGMGLYLVNKYAVALNMTVIAENAAPDGQGFHIMLLFPVVDA